MSGQQIGTVVGGIVGAYFGMPQLGMAIGGLIGGAIDPTKINGPHIGDGQTQTATDGSAISWAIGTVWVAGCIVQVGERREVKVKDSGKGGPEVSHYEAHQDFAILICESSEIRNSTINQVLMIEQDGKIVYDVRPSSKILSDSQKYKANVDFMYGAEDQLPHPTLEAISGVGNTVPYRGSCVAVFKDFNLTAAGDRIPTFRFLVSASVSKVLAYPATDASIDPTSANSVVVYGNLTVQIPSDATADNAVFSVWPQGNIPPGQNEWFCGYGRALNNDTHAYIDFDLAGGNYVTKEEALTAAKSAGILSLGYASSWTVWLYDQPNDDNRGNFYILAAAKGAVSKLSQVVQAICNRGGLSSTDIDLIGLGDEDVLGYTVARQSTASDCLLVLLQAYFAYGTEFDGKIHFNYYGEDALITINKDDLIEASDANNNAITETKRNQATEFPRKIIATYYDPDQNFMAVDAFAERTAQDVVAIGETKIEMPVAMPGDQAAQAAQKALKVAYAKLEGTRDYCLPFARAAAYITVCAGEAVLMDGKRWVLDEVDLSTGYLKYSSRYDRQSAYKSNLQVITGLPPTTPVSRYSGPTTLVPMNLPSLRPQDTYGLYLAAASADGRAAWKGCNVLISFDDQQTWQSVLTITQGSTLGTVVDAEPSGGEPLTVNVDGTGDLVSATPEQIAANANVFALVNGDTAQVGQFANATQDSSGNYEVTTITRGLLGTTETPATAGQRFTMLDSVYFLPIDLSFKGKVIALRAVGFNEVAEDQPVVTITYNPDTTVIVDGGEIA